MKKNGYYKYNIWKTNGLFISYILKKSGGQPVDILLEDISIFLDPFIILCMWVFHFEEPDQILVLGPSNLSISYKRY